VFSHRDQLMQWAEQGRIPPGRLHDALRMAGVTPSATDWRRFLELATLWLGVVLLGAAVIFFFAYNWQALGRFAKFGIVEALLIGAVVAALRLGLDRPAGQAALTGAVLLTGALLALVGQVYQTGADPWELFAAWAGATLAWVLIGRIGGVSPQAGQTANLDSITAVVIGGTSLFGGRGSIIGTLIGALIVGVFRNGLALSGLDVLWQEFTVGVLIIVAVALDQWIRRVSS